MRPAVLCIVPEANVGVTIEALKSEGLTNNDISVLVPHAEALKNTALTPDLVHGAEIGSIVGGAIGGLANLTSLVIAGIGPFLVAGPLATLFVGVVAGTVMGGLTGATGDLAEAVGIPRSVAHRFERQLEAGSGLFFVHYQNERELGRVKDIFGQAGASEIHSTEEAAGLGEHRSHGSAT